MSIAEMTEVVSQDFGAELKEKTVGCRLSIKRWGTKKALEDSQVKQAADEFAANDEFVSASKKLINTKDSRFKAITKALGKARKYWEAVTVPYPDNGIRLLRTDRVQEFEIGLMQIRHELNEALQAFDYDFDQVKQAAKHELGDLYNAADYPDSVLELFKVQHEYCDITPPKHLMELHPEIYERETLRIRAKFDEAVQMAEDAFVTELQEMLDHAIERLTDEEGGKGKVFKESLIGNFNEFIDRFGKLNVGSNGQLTKLVEDVKGITKSISPELLRKSGDIRAIVRDQMQEARQYMDQMVVDRPTRRFKHD